MTASELHSSGSSREQSGRSLLPASRVGFGGMVTPTLGFELEPGVPQRLGKVVIHRTCDGDRVGHGRCFSVVFPQAAAEVFLNHRVARRVGYGVEQNKKLRMEECLFCHQGQKKNYRWSSSGQRGGWGSSRSCDNATGCSYGCLPGHR